MSGTYDNQVPSLWIGQEFGADTVFLSAIALEGPPDGFPVYLNGIRDREGLLARQNLINARPAARQRLENRDDRLPRRSGQIHRSS